MCKNLLQLKKVKIYRILKNKIYLFLRIVMNFPMLLNQHKLDNIHNKKYYIVYNND